MQQESQEVFKCIYHENNDLICTPLTNFLRSTNIEIDYKLVSNANNICKATICDTFKEGCIWQKCGICSSSNLYQLFEPLNMYIGSQWEYMMVKKDNDLTNIIKKVQQKLSVESILVMLEKQLATFSIHNYTKIVQLHHSNIKKNIWKKMKLL